MQQHYQPVLWMATCDLDGGKHEGGKRQQTRNEHTDTGASNSEHAEHVQVSPEVEGRTPPQQENQSLPERDAHGDPKQCQGKRIRHLQMGWNMIALGTQQ